MPKAARRAVAPKRVKSKTKAKASAVADKLADIITFGEAMLGQNAIDPAYAAIHAARLPLDQQKRLLIAYCLFYHLGLAAYLSQLEGTEFWRAVEIAANNKTSPSATDSALPHGRWPRVADRRHFRGQKCVEAVQELARRFPQPEALVDYLIAPEPGTDVLTAAVVIKRALTFKQWGPWAAWKFADLAETLGLAPIVFPLDSRLLPPKPRAVLIDLGGESTLRELSAHFSQIPAPPRFVRNCGLQEIETILCRYGSHLNGSTEVGKNIREIRDNLTEGWGPTADKLLECMPAEVGVGGDHHDQADAAIKVVSPPTIKGNRNVILGEKDDRGPKVPTTGVTDTTITTDLPEPDIEYEDAVVRGKAIVARLDNEWWALCALADRVKPKHGPLTLRRFFADIGIGGGGERRHSVYSSWRDIFAGWLDDESAPGPMDVPYTVLRELQTLPNRGDLLRKNPQMSKDVAVVIRKRHDNKTKAQPSWQNEKRDNIKKQLAEIEDAAKQLEDFELKLSAEPGNNRLLLEEVTPQWMDRVRNGLAAGHRSLDVINHLEQNTAARDNQEAAGVEDEAAASLEHYRGAAAALGLEAGRLRTAADGLADDAAPKNQKQDHNANAAPQ